MKKNILLFSVAILGAFSANAQTATNFNCNDCAGNNHDLFSELDAGKVIVISFVMPCTSCIGPTLTASNVVQSYASSNPGQVKMYVCDDVANTNCTSLNSWVNSNGIVADATFSNSAAVETPYGSFGMPTIVVLGGGTSHTVFFNQQGTAAGNSTNLQNAINTALATGIHEASGFNAVDLFPNPATAQSTLTFTTGNAGHATIAVYDQLGQQVMEVFSGALVSGENKFSISTAQLANGIYFVRISEAESSRMVKLVVSR